MEYFPCYNSYKKKLKNLSDQEVGRLFRALMDYNESGERQELAGRESIAYDFIVDDIDRARRKNKSGRRKSRGENHWNWKGGITPKNQVERNSVYAHQWRKSVFERDGYTCQCCGQVGGRLNAHHIKHWATNPDLRYEVDNGITLCETCHKLEHKK